MGSGRGCHSSTFENAVETAQNITWKVFIPVQDLDVKGDEYSKRRIKKIS